VLWDKVDALKQGCSSKGGAFAVVACSRPIDRLIKPTFLNLAMAYPRCLFQDALGDVGGLRRSLASTRARKPRDGSTFFILEGSIYKFVSLCQFPCLFR
jgi:hypothetical protein